MKYTLRNRTSNPLRGLAAVSLAAALIAPATLASAQIDATNWGLVTNPVYGTSQTGTYAGAERFAGPNQFGDGIYYHGVLPNGKIINPAGTTIQIGTNPLGLALTPDGRYLITSNDDEREGGFASLYSTLNVGGYSISVIDTSTMTVVSQIAPGQAYIGLAVKTSGSGYTVYASTGPGNSVKLFNVTAGGAISAGTPASITIAPFAHQLGQNYVSHYAVAAGSQAATTTVKPAGYSTAGAAITFPAGSALDPTGRYLYVACNGDNSLAVIDTTTNTVIKQVSVGYFPYGVSVSNDGTKVYVANWGVTDYLFANVTFNAAGSLTNLNSIGNLPSSFSVVPTDPKKTSSISVISVPGGNPNNIVSSPTTVAPAISEATGLDPNGLTIVGESHPSASAIVRRGSTEVLYVCKANSDSLGLILVNNNRKLPDFNLSPLSITLADGHKVHGSYPDAIAVSPDGTRAYVAEAGLNSVAVLDTTIATAPKLLGRIPTAWYPTGVTVSGDGTKLYVVSAKGVAGDFINPTTNLSLLNTSTQTPAQGTQLDSNYMFGTAQQIDLTTLSLDNTTVLGYNYAIQTSADTSVVPIGGAASSKIKHVFFILGENKTFDSFFGDVAAFAPYASKTFNARFGGTASDDQFTQIIPNLHLLAQNFAVGVNYYSDAEESDAGHQYAASGTATDYTEKTLLNKGGRGLLVNKNFEAEDYPEGGYLYNNAARNNVSFKLYGLEAARIIGTDTGTGTPTTVNDPLSGNAGAPALSGATGDAFSSYAVQLPLSNQGDTGLLDGSGNPLAGQTKGTSPGVGQSFFLNYPGLKVVGTNDPVTGEPRLDQKYPGYNFNISDQRRAQEFIADFDRMSGAATLPQFLYIYLPNMHTGGVQAPNASIFTAAATASGGKTGPQLVADGDAAIGMVVQHIMKSSVYYNSADGTGSAIIFVPDDSQSSLDHIHQHRAPLLVISPYAKPGLAKRHYNTASVVKTEELLLGLPPNNYGDLFATDLRDMFQSTYNGISIDSTGNLNGQSFTRFVAYQPSREGRKIWALVKSLNTSHPDQDSLRLGALNRLTMKADDLHKRAAKRHHLHSKLYKAAQARLYKQACALVKMSAPRDSDD